MTPVAPSRATLASRIVRELERGGDRLFGQQANPLRRLGGLAVFMFWVALASGTYLYIFFDTAGDAAYASIESLRRDQPWFGGWVRSAHRYASDAFALSTLLHIAREWALGRYRGFRWFSWLTGLPPVMLALACGMVGYWLVADTRALFVAAGIGEWTGWLPGVGDAFVRNFVTEVALSDRLFSLVIFLHIGIGLFVLVGLWVHLHRLPRPATNPARSTALWAMATLVVGATLWPALSEEPARFDRLATAMPIDWFFLWPLPLMHRTSPGWAWAVVAGITACLAVLPWLARGPRPAAARVDLEHCNGCGRCFDDCPFGAVVMAPRRDGRRYAAQAVVHADLCAGCGICVGACPSSTPFRSVRELVTGIDLPQQPLHGVRETLRAALRAQPAATVVFGCDEGARAGAAARAGAGGVVVLSLPCVGMLPPAFVDYALRAGAPQVIVASCGEGGCTYRFGARWTGERLAGRREPILRVHARGPRVHTIVAVAGDEAALVAAVARAAAQHPSTHRTEVTHV